MLLLSYLYDISERQTEQVAKLDLAPKESLGLGLPAHTIAADRRYDGSGNHCLLRSLGLHSAIRLNEYRTCKKDKNRRGWIAVPQESEYVQRQEERYKIETKFGSEARTWSKQASLPGAETVWR